MEALLKLRYMASVISFSRDTVMSSYKTFRLVRDYSPSQVFPNWLFLLYVIMASKMILIILLETM